MLFPNRCPGRFFRRRAVMLNAFCVLLMVVVPVQILSPAPSYSQTVLANACADGRIDSMLDDFETTDGDIFKPDPIIPNPLLSLVSGCHGNALSIGYDLTAVAPPASANPGQSWVVLRRVLPMPRDVRSFTHLRLALRGTNPNSHDTLEFKLWDSTGSGKLATISLRSMTDLPAWRPIYIDLREFANIGELDLSKIAGIEIGIVRCAGCEVWDNPGVAGPPEQHTGSLLLDELGLVNLKPGAPHRLVETGFELVTENRDVRLSSAKSLLAQITSTGPGAGLIPAWFPEASPNYNSYAQAEALLVFLYEYQRTQHDDFRNAARNLAKRMIDLQIPAGKTQAGAWYTGYTIHQGQLIPPNRALPRDQAIACDGNESMIADPNPGGTLVASNIDACEWVGNVGWMLIALSKLQQVGIYDDPPALDAALERGATWLAGQAAYRGNSSYPDLISLGIEGNISAYFGLRAAHKDEAAAKLGQAIFDYGWDPVQRRIRPGVSDYATALDVSGSWGATFLRAIGKRQEALDSQGYTASVMRTSSFNGLTTGYGDIAGPYTVSVEFAAQAAAAGMHEANGVMQALYSLQIQSGAYSAAFPGATDHWYGGQLEPWNTTMPGVSPTAWVYFANHWDPLIEVMAARVYLPKVSGK